MRNVIVIGAGIGGLASAIRLAAKGYQVTIYEKNTGAGGKISEIKAEGFRWDTGPSLLTLPYLIEELFTLCGKNSTDYISFKPLPLVTRYFFNDGTEINAWARPELFAAEIEAKTNDTAKTVLKYLASSEAKYNMTKEVFLNRSLHKASTYFIPAALSSYLKLYKLQTFKSLHNHNVHTFQDDRTQRIFDRFATYNGSDPYRAPATLSLIPHLEHKLGAYYPAEGIYSIITALEKLANEMGVQIHYESIIEKIRVKNKRAIGVLVNGILHTADIVISNADVWHTYRHLLKEEKAPQKILESERSSSALIFYWGINGSFPRLDLHNIFFTENYLQEFQCIFNEKQVYDDPTIYVYISSKENTNDAPDGCENWFVMINVPADTSLNWTQIKVKAREWIINKLNKVLDIKLEDYITQEEIIDPPYLEEKTSSYQGALYGNASNTPFAAFLRHPNFSSRIKGLYFCGGSVHPGGGIPLCLLSAKIAVDSIPEVRQNQK